MPLSFTGEKSKLFYNEFQVLLNSPSFSLDEKNDRLKKILKEYQITSNDQEIIKELILDSYNKNKTVVVFQLLNQVNLCVSKESMNNIINEIFTMPNVENATKQEAEFWVKSLNVLGNVPLPHIARTLPFEELEGLMHKHDLIYPEFLARFKETQQRISLVHIWGIDHFSSWEGFTFKAHGSQSRLMRSELKKYLTKFTDSIKAEWFSSINLQLPDLAVMDILNMAKETIGSMQGDVQKMLMKEGESKGQQEVLRYPDNIICYTQRTHLSNQKTPHAVSIGLYKNYCYFMNRGGSTKTPQSVVYALNDLEHLKQIVKFKTDPNLTIDEESILDYLKTHAVLIDNLPKKSQLSNTCGWIAAKGNYEAALYFSTLKKLTIEGTAHTQNDFFAARLLATTVMKYFGIFARYQSLSDYMTEDSLNRDQELLGYIHLKAQFKSENPKWQHDKKPLLMLFNNQHFVQPASRLEHEFNNALFAKNYVKINLLTRQGYKINNEKFQNLLCGEHDFKIIEFLMENNDLQYLPVNWIAVFNSLVNNKDDEKKFSESYKILELFVRKGVACPGFNSPLALFNLLYKQEEGSEHCAAIKRIITLLTPVKSKASGCCAIS